MKPPTQLRSEKQSIASRQNGSKGGRPRKFCICPDPYHTAHSFYGDLIAPNKKFPEDDQLYNTIVNELTFTLKPQTSLSTAELCEIARLKVNLNRYQRLLDAVLSSTRNIASTSAKIYWDSILEAIPTLLSGIPISNNSPLRTQLVDELLPLASELEKHSRRLHRRSTKNNEVPNNLIWQLDCIVPDNLFRNYNTIEGLNQKLDNPPAIYDKDYPIFKSLCDKLASKANQSAQAINFSKNEWDGGIESMMASRCQSNMQYVKEINTLMIQTENQVDKKLERLFQILKLEIR